MIRLVTINKAVREFIKVLISNEDIKEADNFQNFGIDSKPVKGAKGLLISTESNKTNAIIGYLYRSDKTEIGETRLYATDTEGNEIGNVKLNTSGEFVILDGENYAVKFNELKAEFNKLKDWAEGHTHPITGLTAGPYPLAGTMLSPTDNSGANIDNCKVDKVRI